MLLDLVEEAYALYSAMENNRSNGLGVIARYTPEILLKPAGITVKAPIFKKLIDDVKAHNPRCSQWLIALRIKTDLNTPANHDGTFTLNSKFDALAAILKLCAECVENPTESSVRASAIEPALQVFAKAFEDSKLSEEQKSNFIKKVHCYCEALAATKGLLQPSNIAGFITERLSKYKITQPDYANTMWDFMQETLCSAQNAALCNANTTIEGLKTRHQELQQANAELEDRIKCSQDAKGKLAAETMLGSLSEDHRKLTVQLKKLEGDLRVANQKLAARSTPNTPERKAEAPPAMLSTSAPLSTTLRAFGLPTASLIHSGPGFLHNMSASISQQLRRAAQPSEKEDPATAAMAAVFHM
jgi:hypothetical protein